MDYCLLHGYGRNHCTSFHLEDNETKGELFQSLQSVPSSRRISYETSTTLIIHPDNNTKIDHIPRELFTLFPNLDTLVSYLQISQLNASDLVNAKELKRFDASKSKKLRRLSTGSFPSLSLKVLYLEENEIERVEDFAFANLTSLKHLSLNDNKLGAVNHTMFAGLVDLWSLYLDRNRIQAIEVGAFDDLKNLLHLSLNGNKINALDIHVFVGPGKLRQLELEYNPFESIDNFLYNLTTLTEISLEGNHLISDLDLMKFARLPRLRKLNLSGTAFNLDKYNISAEYSSSSLEELFLANNNLTNIASFEVLRMFRNLWRLDLSGNEKLSGKGEEIREILYPKLTALEL